MAENDWVSLESYLASLYGGEKGAKYAGSVIQARDELIKGLNEFKGSAKSIDFLKGDIAEIWHGRTYNLAAAQQSSPAHAEVPRSTGLGSSDIVLNSGERFQLKFYKTAKDSVKAQATSYKQTAKNPATQKGANEILQSGEVSEFTPVRVGLYHLIS